MFVSIQAAYGGLSDAVKEKIEPLKATHSSRQIFGYKAAEAEAVGDRFGNADLATQDAVHSITLEHPHTGRKGIHVNAHSQQELKAWRKRKLITFSRHYMQSA